MKKRIAIYFFSFFLLVVTPAYWCLASSEEIILLQDITRLETNLAQLIQRQKSPYLLETTERSFPSAAEISSLKAEIEIFHVNIENYFMQVPIGERKDIAKNIFQKYWSIISSFIALEELSRDDSIKTEPFADKAPLAESFYCLKLSIPNESAMRAVSAIFQLFLKTNTRVDNDKASFAQVCIDEKYPEGIRIGALPFIRSAGKERLFRISKDLILQNFISQYTNLKQIDPSLPEIPHLEAEESVALLRGLRKVEAENKKTSEAQIREIYLRKNLLDSFPASKKIQVNLLGKNSEHSDAEMKQWIGEWERLLKEYNLNFIDNAIDTSDTGLVLPIYKILFPEYTDSEESRSGLNAFLDYLKEKQFKNFPAYLQKELFAYPVQLFSLESDNAQKALSWAIARAQAECFVQSLTEVEGIAEKSEEEKKNLDKILLQYTEKYREGISQSFIQGWIGKAKGTVQSHSIIEISMLLNAERWEIFQTTIYEQLLKIKTIEKEIPKIDFSVFAQSVSSLSKYQVSLAKFGQWRKKIIAGKTQEAAKAIYFEQWQEFIGEDLSQLPVEIQLRSMEASCKVKSVVLERMVSENKVKKKIDLRSQLDLQEKIRNAQNCNLLFEFGKDLHFFDSGALNLASGAGFSDQAIQRYREFGKLKIQEEYRILFEESDSKNNLYKNMDKYFAKKNGGESEGASESAWPKDLTPEDKQFFSKLLRNRLATMANTLAKEMQSVLLAKNIDDLGIIVTKSQLFRKLLEKYPALAKQHEKILWKSANQSMERRVWDKFFHNYLVVGGLGLLSLQGMHWLAPRLLPKSAVVFQGVMNVISPYLFGYSMAAFGSILANTGLETKEWLEKQEEQDLIYQLTTTNPIVNQSEKEKEDLFFSVADAEIAQAEYKIATYKYVMARSIDVALFVGLPAFFVGKNLLGRTSKLAKEKQFQELFAKIGLSNEAPKASYWDMAAIEDAATVRIKNIKNAFNEKLRNNSSTNLVAILERSQMQQEIAETIAAKDKLLKILIKEERRLQYLSYYYRWSFETLGIPQGTWDYQQIRNAFVDRQAFLQGNRVALAELKRAQDDLIMAMDKFIFLKLQGGGLPQNIPYSSSLLVNLLGRPQKWNPIDTANPITYEMISTADGEIFVPRAFARSARESGGRAR